MAVKDALEAIGLGILFMFIAVIIQEIIQEVPFFIYLYFWHISLAGSISRYSDIEVEYPLIFSIYLGIIAGIFQEFFTYVSVDTRKKNMAIFIGIGFAIVDIIFLFAKTSVPSVDSIIMVLVLFNIISSILFHIGTATFIKWGQIIGSGKATLGISIILHSLIDGGLVYSDLYILKKPSSYDSVIEIYWAFTIIISIMIFFIGTRTIRSVEEHKIVEKAVVY